MTKRGEIAKSFAARRITRRQHDTLMRHEVHHSLAHVRKMLELMEAGESFTRAHKVAMRSVGK